MLNNLQLRTLLVRCLGDHLHLFGGQNLEIYFNEDGSVFTDGPEGKRAEGGVFSADRRDELARLIASALGEELSEGSPILQGEFTFQEYGRFRVQGFAPPVVRGVALMFRRLAPRVFPLYGDPEGFVERGIMSLEMASCIRRAMVARKNILLVGDMGSGKTTLANGILGHLAEWAPNDRVTILEDTPEIQCPLRNTLCLRSGEIVDLPTLCRSAFRTGSDRIVLGEVRGAEALQLLLLWAGGHGGGVSTMHGSSARGALLRLNGLARIASASSQEDLIVAGIQLVVVLKRLPGGGRRVVDIRWLSGFDRAKGEFIFDSTEAGV